MTKNIFRYIAIIIAVIGIIGWYISRDIPSPDTSDLVLNMPEIAPENNAYTYFMSATNSFYWPTNSVIVLKHLDGKPVDLDTISEIIATNGTMLTLINQGIECQRCITPEITGFDTPLPYIGCWLNMGMVLAAKTQEDRLAGRYVDATDTCITLLKFGDLIQQDAQAIIQGLVGCTVLEFGLAQARELTRSPNITINNLDRLAVALDNLSSVDHCFINVFKCEYKVDSNTIDELDTRKLSVDNFCIKYPFSSILSEKDIPRYFFQPNKTKLTFANIHRQAINNVTLYYSEMNQDYIEDTIWSGNISKIELTLKPNVVGKLLYAMLLPAHEEILERKCRMECSIEATRLLIAIHIYETNTGELPQTLNDLVPDYIQAVPIDPYDGKPFRYNLENGIFYSVGRDCKDSGGSSIFPIRYKGRPFSTTCWKTEDFVFGIQERIEPIVVSAPSEEKRIR